MKTMKKAMLAIAESYEEIAKRAAAALSKGKP
jgi:hypothetical protein